MNLRSLLLSFLLVAVLLAGGCGSKKGVTLTGQLLVDGKPYAAPEKTDVNITFTPVDTTAKLPACLAEYKRETGDFTVQGAVRGRGIQPGKYKVAVTASDYSSGKGDVFKDAFSEAKTPLSYEVTASSQSIVIDLTKRTVTAK
jgi:hypothetical protein